MYTSPMRILFFGTPDFAATSLKEIVNAGFLVVGVVTAADKPAGRGQKISQSAVKKTAKDLGLTLFQPEKLRDPHFISAIGALKIDLGVVIAFRMLPEIVWNLPRLGTINLHGSLLPQYRGAAPIHHAIINGETYTGVTTFFLKHEIDTGDTITNCEMLIGENENVGQVHDRMMILGAELMVKTLHLINQDSTNPRPQVFHNSLKLAPKLNRAFCELNAEMSLVDFHNKVRGLSPLPGAWIKSPMGEMKILSGQIHSRGQEADKGLRIVDKRLFIFLADGCYEILDLQIPGKSKTNAKDFVNGIKN